MGGCQGGGWGAREHRHHHLICRRRKCAKIMTPNLETAWVGSTSYDFIIYYDFVTL